MYKLIYCDIVILRGESIPELKACIAHRQTRQEALRKIEIAKNLWIECALEDGLE